MEVLAQNQDIPPGSSFINEAQKLVQQDIVQYECINGTRFPANVPQCNYTQCTVGSTCSRAVEEYLGASPLAGNPTDVTLTLLDVAENGTIVGLGSTLARTTEVSGSRSIRNLTSVALRVRTPSGGVIDVSGTAAFTLATELTSRTEDPMAQLIIQCLKGLLCPPTLQAAIMTGVTNPAAIGRIVRDSYSLPWPFGVVLTDAEDLLAVERPDASEAVLRFNLPFLHTKAPAAVWVVWLDIRHSPPSKDTNPSGGSDMFPANNRRPSPRKLQGTTETVHARLTFDLPKQVQGSHEAPSPPPEHDGNQGSTGLVLAITLGCGGFVALVLIIIGIVAVKRRRRRQRQQHREAEASTAASSHRNRPSNQAFYDIMGVAPPRTPHGYSPLPGTQAPSDQRNA